MSGTEMLTTSPSGAAAGNSLLLDVRELDEWIAGHAPDAMHIPLMELPDRLDTLPTDRPIVCVCRSGGRSARATEFLRHHGFDAINMVGGMKAWAEEGLPVVRIDGGTGAVI